MPLTEHQLRAKIAAERSRHDPEPTRIAELRKQHREAPLTERVKRQPASAPPLSQAAPWRPVGAVAASLGAPVGIGMLHPMLGEGIAIIELMVVLTIIATALFGSQALSERAFRLLRWFGNRPEPPTPGDKQAGGVRDATPPGR